MSSDGVEQSADAEAADCWPSLLIQLVYKLLGLLLGKTLGGPPPVLVPHLWLFVLAGGPCIHLYRVDSLVVERLPCTYSLSTDGRC